MTKSMMARAAALITVPLAIALLASCGTTEPQANNTVEPTSEVLQVEVPEVTVNTFDDWQLALAKCLRSEGIDYADPDPNSKEAFRIDDAGMDEFIAATEKCKGSLGAPPAAPGQSPGGGNTNDELLKTAQCLRGKGLDVADPQPGRAMGIPSDISEEIRKECLPNTSGGSSADLGQQD